jgi:catechol 2,3-dioxygenase-like lactoylglutathione lyase family enzyme
VSSRPTAGPAGDTTSPSRSTPKDVEAWQIRLDSEGVAVESVVTWPGGAKSIYFRDPDGNLAELITPGFWSIY